MPPASGPGVPSATQDEGSLRERDAEALLSRLGFEVLERNWRHGQDELDLVARDGEVLVFVEVRSRRSVAHGRPAATVGVKKQRKLARAALAYLGLTRDGAAGGVRFDVVEVVAHAEGAELVLLRGAFDASVLYRRGCVPLL